MARSQTVRIRQRYRLFCAIIDLDSGHVGQWSVGHWMRSVTALVAELEVLAVIADSPTIVLIVICTDWDNSFCSSTSSLATN